MTRRSTMVDVIERIAGPVDDTYAQMDLRGLAAEAMRERDQLRTENERLTAALKAADLVHIRLRAGLREALDLADDFVLGRFLATGRTRDEGATLIAELRKLVSP